MSEVDVIVGTLGRAHGLMGDLFVNVRTDSPEQRFAPGSVLCADGSRTLTVARFRFQGSRGLVGFEEVDDRTGAEGLTGAELVAKVAAEESPEEPGWFYDHQLVGLAAVTTDGEPAGTVARVEHMGFQDMLVVATPTGERMVPFVDELVPDVDLEAGRVVVRAIPGLLEDEG